MSSSELTNNHDDPSAAAFDVLRQFARKRETRPPTEQCELCTEAIPTNHRHLLEISKRTLICVCQPCSILFGDPGAGGGKYRLVPSRYLIMPDFQMTDEQWDNLMIPVNMVYMFRSTLAKRVMAFYPSPAGAMESMLDLEGWEELVSSNPLLNDLEPDVEALLINRVQRGGDNYREHFIVPIDACYELVGLIRLHWKGLSGGDEVWKAIAEFFAGLRKRATTVGRSADTQQIAPTPWRGVSESHVSNDASASSLRSGDMKGEANA
jgi:Family of unknown function (DUF5947)